MRKKRGQGMRKQWIEIYCPKCGEYSILEGEYPMVGPTTDWRLDCPVCGTAWNVQVGFYEVEKETDDACLDKTRVR